MDNNNEKEFIEHLEEEIMALMMVLQGMDPAEDDYKVVSNNLKVLLESKEEYQKCELKKIEIESKKNESELRQLQLDSDIEARNSESELKRKLLETEIQAKVDEINRLNNTDIPLIQRVDPNVIIKGAVGLASVILVLKHEKLEVIASKAFGLLPRLLC